MSEKGQTVQEEAFDTVKTLPQEGILSQAHISGIVSPLAPEIHRNSRPQSVEKEDNVKIKFNEQITKNRPGVLNTEEKNIAAAEERDVVTPLNRTYNSSSNEPQKYERPTPRPSGIQRNSSPSQINNIDRASNESRKSINLGHKSNTGGFKARDSQMMANQPRTPAADELMWLNFETRMRNMIRGLMEPVVDMSQKDREGMIIMEDNFNGHDDRLARIEEAIFNVAMNGEETLFEKMAKKIKNHEIFLKTHIKGIQDKQQAKHTEIDGRLFNMDNKVRACLNVKEELLNLESEQQNLKEFINKYNKSTIDENKDIRSQISDTTVMLQKQLNSNYDRLDNLGPRMAAAEGKLIGQSKRMDIINGNMEQHTRHISELQEKKLNVKEDKINRRSLEKRMKVIDEAHGTLLNTQLALESYVEKYMPLKMQHQMSETIIDCLEKKAKIRFIELNTIMANTLRDEIIRDNGHPKLKAKCLDLITKLRVESAVLNVTKTAKAEPEAFKPNITLVNSKNFTNDDKEELGLDAHGQIKISHGAEEIKAMLDKGMIKTYGRKTTRLAETQFSGLDGMVAAGSQAKANGAAANEEDRGQPATDGKEIKANFNSVQSQKEIETVQDYKQATNTILHQNSQITVGSASSNIRTGTDMDESVDGQEDSVDSPTQQLPLPGLQRTGHNLPSNKMSTIDDGYDTEAMAKIEANTKEQIDKLKQVCFKQIELSLKEHGTNLYDKIDFMEQSYKSQITETQAAISAIQLDQDQMLDKVRGSQSEILVINKNLAANLKKQRSEIQELHKKTDLNQTIIESILVQSIALEQATQINFDKSFGGSNMNSGGGMLNIKSNRLNQLSQDHQQLSVISANTSLQNSSQRFKGSSTHNSRLAQSQSRVTRNQSELGGNYENERQYLSKANDQLRRCQIALFRYQKSNHKQGAAMNISQISQEAAAVMKAGRSKSYKKRDVRNNQGTELVESHSHEYLQTGVYSTTNTADKKAMPDEIQRIMGLKPSMSDVDAMLRYHHNQSNQTNSNSVEIWPNHYNENDPNTIAFSPADLKTLNDPNSTHQLLENSVSKPQDSIQSTQRLNINQDTNRSRVRNSQNLQTEQFEPIVQRTMPSQFTFGRNAASRLGQSYNTGKIGMSDLISASTQNKTTPKNGNPKKNAEKKPSKQNFTIPIPGQLPNIAVANLNNTTSSGSPDETDLSVQNLKNAMRMNQTVTDKELMVQTQHLHNLSAVNYNPVL